jgi:excisionase family DNA binding protein
MSELENLVRELARAVVRDELERLAPTWDWLTIAQAADLLGCSPKAVYSKIKRGTVTAHRHDGRVFVSRKELDAAIRGARVDT